MIPVGPLEWVHWLYLSGALALLVVAVALVLVRPYLRANWAAAYLVGAIGLRLAVFALGISSDAASVFWSPVSQALSLGLTAAAVYFFFAFREGKGGHVEPRAGAGQGPWILAGLGVALVLLVLARAVVDQDSSLALVGVTVAGMERLSMVLAGFLLLRDYGRSTSDIGRTALLLGGSAIMLWGLYRSALLLSARMVDAFTIPGVRFASAYDIGFFAYEAAWLASSVGAGAWAVARLSAWGWRAGDPRMAHPERLALFVLSAAVVTGVSLALMGALPGVASFQLAWIRVATWFWAAMLPSLLVYAALKYEVFGLDLGIKLGIQRSIIAGALVLTFVALSEAAELAIQNQTGSRVIGVAGAAGLLFFLAPLERAARRVTDSLMPRVENERHYRDRRAQEIYEASVEHALTDGRILKAERALLDLLRTRLGVEAVVAKAIEREARKRFAVVGQG